MRCCLDWAFLESGCLDCLDLVFPDTNNPMAVCSLCRLAFCAREHVCFPDTLGPTDRRYSEGAPFALHRTFPIEGHLAQRNSVATTSSQKKTFREGRAHKGARDAASRCAPRRWHESPISARGASSPELNQRSYGAPSRETNTHSAAKEAPPNGSGQ